VSASASKHRAGVRATIPAVQVRAGAREEGEEECKREKTKRREETCQHASYFIAHVDMCFNTCQHATYTQHVVSGCQHGPFFLMFVCEAIRKFEAT